MWHWLAFLTAPALLHELEVVTELLAQERARGESYRLLIEDYGRVADGLREQLEKLREVLRMSDLARAGVEQAISGVQGTADLAVKALDVGTGTAIDAVRTLVGVAGDTAGHINDLAEATLTEIEEERADLIERINGFQQRTTERLGTLMTKAADAIPGPV